MPTESKRSRAVEAFPEDDWQSQIGDTFACLSVALFDTIHRILRHTCHLLLKHLAKADPKLYADLFAELYDRMALFGDDKEYREFFWSKEQCQEISTISGHDHRFGH